MGECRRTGQKTESQWLNGAKKTGLIAVLADGTELRMAALTSAFSTEESREGLHVFSVVLVNAANRNPAPPAETATVHQLQNTPR